MAKKDIKFNYFHGYESEQFAFYRIPKALFTNDYFRDLSSDAKILYGLMLDRMSLSIKHHWVDECDRVYIIFTLEQVMEYMNCGRDKGMKVLAELDTKKGIGLIERVKQGFGKPDVIYVKSFIINEKAKGSNETEKDDLSRSEKSTCQGRENRPDGAEETDLSKSEKPTYRGRKNRPDEVEETDLSRSKKPTYRSRKGRLDEVVSPDPNYTNNTYTDTKNTNPIYPSDQFRQETEMDMMETIRAYMELVKENIAYDTLIASCGVQEREYIDEIVDLIVEIVSIPRKTVVIAGVAYPYGMVQGRLLKINNSHIQYVLSCLNRNTTKVQNIKAYLLTCIFNAPSTINSYYRAEVNHDMYGVV